jgi:hypothetical protein
VLPQAAEGLRVLLSDLPTGRADVPFRPVASHLMRPVAAISMTRTGCVLANTAITPTSAQSAVDHRS